MMRLQKHIFLLGMPGSGKSTTGKLLANALELRFIDSDQEIEKVAGVSIAEIFEKHDEMYFRKMELDFLSTLGAGPFVVATGGGMPMFFDNLTRLKSKGVLIYLSASAQVLSTRIERQKNVSRPLLKPSENKNLVFVLQKTLDRRAYIYEQSDFIVDAQQTPEMVVKDIVNMLQ